MTKHYYYTRASELNRALKRRFSGSTLKDLHYKQAWRHGLVALRQVLLYVGLPLLIYHVSQPWLWIPAAILQGFVVFSFTVLVHEVVHKCVFARERSGLNMWLGRFYATLSGLSYHQFRRWHLDHHNELGDAKADPKRAHLSPKRNARWYKLLYATPALYPIYFRAAAVAQKGYKPELRRIIARERAVTIAFHLTMLGLFFWIDPSFGLKAYVLPVFFVFPIAFALNRLGQHYVIDPEDVAAWSTLMRPNACWNFLFLFSSYHLEHHYYPGVPFYNLKPLQRELEPFFEERGIKALSYTRLVKLWLWDNHEPHSAVRPPELATVRKREA